MTRLCSTRALLATVLLLAAVALLVACGNTDGSASPAPDAAASPTPRPATAQDIDLIKAASANVATLKSYHLITEDMNKITVLSDPPQVHELSSSREERDVESKERVYARTVSDGRVLEAATYDGVSYFRWEGEKWVEMVVDGTIHMEFIEPRGLLMKTNRVGEYSTDNLNEQLDEAVSVLDMQSGDILDGVPVRHFQLTRDIDPLLPDGPYGITDIWVDPVNQRLHREAYCVTGPFPTEVQPDTPGAGTATTTAVPAAEAELSMCYSNTISKHNQEIKVPNPRAEMPTPTP